MTQTLPALIRDTAATLVVIVVASGMVSGLELASQTLVSGIVAIINFLLLAFVVRTLARAAAVNRGVGAGLALLALKTFFMLFAFGWLVTAFGSIAPALGVGSVVLALTLRGLADALYVSEDELPEGVV